jgi:hypothetical protein
MSAVAKDQDLRKLLEGLAMKWRQLADAFALAASIRPGT